MPFLKKIFLAELQQKTECQKCQISVIFLKLCLWVAKKLWYTAIYVGYFFHSIKVVMWVPINLALAKWKSVVLDQRHCENKEITTNKFGHGSYIFCARCFDPKMVFQVEPKTKKDPWFGTPGLPVACQQCHHKWGCTFCQLLTGCLTAPNRLPNQPSDARTKFGNLQLAIFTLAYQFSLVWKGNFNWRKIRNC